MSKENQTYDAENIIQCRAANGVAIGASEPWEPNKPVSYIYAPGGVHTISAGFRKDETIKICVVVDEQTAKDLQESFSHITATEKQEPFADEDHESRKATLRYPAGKVAFTYGTLNGEDGVIVSGAEPTSYGAEVVNGKVYRSWSPEFATDADFTKAKCKKGHWTFPDGVRGSESNPARMTAINFVTGALTNKPAFKAMPKVKAKAADAPAEDGDGETVKATGNSEGAKKGWEVRGHCNQCSANAWKASHAADLHGDRLSTEGIEAQRTAAKAHDEAARAHGDAAKYHLDRAHDGVGHDTRNQDADDHAIISRVHEREAGRYRAMAESIHKTLTGADTTPAGATVKADDANALLDLIFARQEQQRFGVSELAARVPMANVRLELDAIIARQSGQPVPVKIVKAAAPEKKPEAAPKDEPTLETIYARMGANT